MVNEHSVLEVLAAVHEVNAEHGQLSARTAEVGVRAQTHKITAEGDDDVGEFRVAAQGQALVRGVQDSVVPFLQRHDGQVRAITGLDLNGLVQSGLRGAGVREDDGGLRESTCANHEVLRTGAAT